MGTYHNVSKKYLPLYLAEFQFRFNNRNEKDIFDKDTPSRAGRGTRNKKVSSPLPYLVPLPTMGRG